MRIFAIGDLHLSTLAQKPMDVFGDKWRGHMPRIEAAWREKISEEDVILIPGDISWAMRFEEAIPDLDWIETLPGTKICIRGNHDYWWDRPKKLNAYYEKIYFLQNKAYSIGKLVICGTRGWTSPNGVCFTKEDEKIYKREIARLQLSLEEAMKYKAKEIWVMLHYPPTYNKEIASPLIELLERYPVTRVIYGHLHDEYSWSEALQGEHKGINYELVAADYLNFTPLLLEEISVIKS